MIKIEIKHRYTGAVLFQVDVDDNDSTPIRTALMAAIRSGRDPEALRVELKELTAELEEREDEQDIRFSVWLASDERKYKLALRGVIERELASPGAGADLADADLARAYLARADLARANLARANLAGADLAGANLAGADLADANLARADLAGANLARANLARADLADANLADADLARADLAGAYLARADLAGAYLAGADLAGADLADADLARAYLARADLARADLAGANLAGADLAGANLAGADLADANLARADLAGANLARANLARADLARADLARADLAGADLADADLAGAKNVPDASGTPSDPPTPYVRAVTDEERRQRRHQRMLDYRARHPDVPVVENLDSRILAAIGPDGAELEMGTWHTCETTHCRAGWAIHLAGKAGYELERRFDSERAGAMIYRASAGYVPHFFAGNETALEDIKRRAQEESTPATSGE